MSPKSTRRRCVFCGSAGPFDREHVLSDWIGLRFGIDDAQRVWHRAETEDGTPRERLYLQKPFRIRVGEVCKSCNGHWMSDLETAVEPVLGPMMTSGVGFPVPADDQELLGFWAAKTLMTL